jgi:hypothetical protein
MDNIFVEQPLDLGRSSNPPTPPWHPGPSRYFGLPMINLGKPLVPPNRPYYWPFNYPEYVKDSNPDAHVRVFKVTVWTNGETKDAKIGNLILPSKILCLIV